MVDFRPCLRMSIGNGHAHDFAHANRELSNASDEESPTVRGTALVVPSMVDFERVLRMSR